MAQAARRVDRATSRRSAAGSRPATEPSSRRRGRRRARAAAGSAWTSRIRRLTVAAPYSAGHDHAGQEEHLHVGLVGDQAPHQAGDQEAVVEALVGGQHLASPRRTPASSAEGRAPGRLGPQEHLEHQEVEVQQRPRGRPARGDDVHRRSMAARRAARRGLVGSALGRGLRRATATPTSASAPPTYAIVGRRLAEEDQAHHDRDRRHEVGRDAEAAGAHVLQREGVRRERDRRREDAEVDHPPDRGRGRVARSRRPAGRRTAGRRPRRPCRPAR